MRKLISLFLVISMFFGFQKIPESMAGERLSLNKAISMAYSASQGMKKTSEQLEGSIQAEKSVNADFLPKAEASYSLRQYQDVPYAQNGAVILKRSDRTHAEWGVGVIQPLFTGFALSSRLEIAKLGTAAMEEERVATRLNVVEGVKKAYYNLLLTRRILDVADEAVENLKAHESDAAKYYAQGVIPLNDLLKTKVELANAIQEKEKAEAGRRMAAASLSLILGGGTDTDYDPEPVDSPMKSGDFAKLDLKEISSSALSKRPELKILRIATKRMDQEARLVRSSYYPTVNLVGRYEKSGDDPAASANDYGNSYNSIAAIEAKWTLFEWGKTAADESRVLHEKKAIEQDISSAEDRVKLEILDAFTSLGVAEKNVKTSKASLDHAKENWRITRYQYQQQVATSTDVLDARTFLSRAETSYHNSFYGYLTGLARLERAAAIEHESEAETGKKAGQP